MSILGFTGFNDLAEFAATTTPGRLTAYVNFRLGRNPNVALPAIGYVCQLGKHGSASYSKTQYGLGLIGFNSASDFGFLSINMANLITGADVPDGAVLNIGVRARGVNSTPQLLAMLSNSVTPSSGQYTTVATVAAPIASGGSSVYLEIQIKRLSATTLQAQYRVNGGTVQTVAVNQSYINGLYIGYSGTVNLQPAGSGFYLTDIYTAYNTSNEDGWLGAVSVGRVTPLNTADTGSLQPSDISTSSQNFIKGVGAAIAYSGTAAISDNDTVAKSATLSDDPWMLTADSSSSINDSNITVLGVNLTTWATTTDTTSGANATSTIKSQDGTVLSSVSFPANSLTTYNGSNVTVDMRDHPTVTPGSLVFEVKNS